MSREEGRLHFSYGSLKIYVILEAERVLRFLNDMRFYVEKTLQLLKKAGLMVKNRKFFIMHFFEWSLWSFWKYVIHECYRKLPNFIEIYNKNCL